jgi:23S rRNA pseudouridine1911/1915/1917 synthase
MPERGEVGAGDAGRRLDTWLAGSFGMSRAEAQRLISAGLVRVDGGTATKSHRVREGESVVVSESSPPAPATATVPYEVRYEDEHLAVVAKPAGVIVHPAPGVKATTLAEALRLRMPLAPAAGESRPGIVHRLDKDTSGLLVVAKTDEAYLGLVRAMRERRIERGYIALVAGSFDMPRGRVEAPVGRSERRPGRMGVTGLGRDAATEFEVVEEIGPATLIEVRLLTGRTHQIRVHLSHIGRPVLGDEAYGRRALPLARRIGLRRPFLHAGRLRFAHPIKGHEVSVQEELPQDLADALAAARRLISAG